MSTLKNLVMTEDYDLFVIGAGPGGLAAAKQAAHYGARVAIAEANHLGGTCANLGCIPKKLMVYAADFAHYADASKGYGWSGDRPQFDWAKFVKARDQAMAQFRQSHERSLTQSGIRLIHDRAVLIDAHTVEVGHQKITADKILLAVGSHPNKLNIPGIEHAVTSDKMFHLPQLPKKIAIIGGGYIGVEFASALRGFGVEVFLMNHEHCILNGFDPAISTAVHQGLTQRGIEIACNTTIKEIVAHDRTLHLTLSNQTTIAADLVLCAIGRTANLDNLGLEQVGIEIDQDAIAVDVHSRTSQPNIFAVGDCTNRKQLTPVALSEGRAFADTIFGDCAWTVDYDSVPSAVCCRPEAASVGMTEPQAQEHFGEAAVRCYQSEFQPLFHSLSGQNEKALIKLVVNSGNDRVIGIHIVGAQAAEMLQGFALAMKKGVTKQEIDHTIGIHPSSAEEIFSMR